MLSVIQLDFEVVKEGRILLQLIHKLILLTVGSELYHGRW
jgi:hypothetical protein